jgi:hypothetical protein
MCKGVGLETLIFEILDALLTDTPEDERQRACRFRQRALPVL